MCLNLERTNLSYKFSSRNTSVLLARNTTSHVQQIREMGTASATAVHSVKRRTNVSARCRNCCQQHPFKPCDCCPAFNSEFKACGKMNHWAKCWLARKPHGNKNKPHQRGRSKSRIEFRQIPCTQPTATDSVPTRFRSRDSNVSKRDFSMNRFRL